MKVPKLKIALQKQGRLADGSTALLKKCGIGFSNGFGKLRAESEDFPIEIYFLRDDDIPEYVADGVADIGIVGENVLAESPKRVETVEKLGFGRCRLSVAVPKNHPAALAYVTQFIEKAKASGVVRRALDDAGLEGVPVAPPAR